MLKAKVPLAKSTLVISHLKLSLEPLAKDPDWDWTYLPNDAEEFNTWPSPNVFKVNRLVVTSAPAPSPPLLLKAPLAWINDEVAASKIPLLPETTLVTIRLVPPCWK